MGTDMERQVPTGTLVNESSEIALLTRILEEGRIARDLSSVPYGKDLIAAFVEQVMSGELVISRDLEQSINDRISQIDRLVSEQVNEIIHNNKFQKIEASWRGLHYLVFETESGVMIKIQVLNVSKGELLKDLENAADFDQSKLFKKIYEKFGSFGDAPFGALIGDYEFSHHPMDMAVLERVSNIAAVAHAPFISAASPQLFGWDRFTSLSQIRDLAKIFEGPEYAKWRSFRETEDARYVGLCLPHILLRLPYGKDLLSTETFNFEEDINNGQDDSKYLWGNAAYALGTRLTEAFAKYHWCAAIRGVESGGLVQGLSAYKFKTGEGELALKCPTEIAITDRREKEFSDLGFIPLIHCKYTDYAAFFAVQSCQRIRKYANEIANANARPSTQLQYIFVVSRFAHYLKVMMRDRTGPMSRKDCESFLNRWILNYVMADYWASGEINAQRPLREARIEVLEIPGKPGVYRAVSFLRPHFQLDELTVSLRLVAELPPAAQVWRGSF
jgi:type VI secretion system protein ImpC